LFENLNLCAMISLGFLDNPETRARLFFIQSIFKNRRYSLLRLHYRADYNNKKQITGLFGFTCVNFLLITLLGHAQSKALI